MKTLITLSLLLASYAGLACQIGINQQNTNNKKISAAANEFNIDLTKVSKIKVKDFDLTILEEEPVYQCPILIHIDAKVTITYKQNLTTQCELSVTVRDVMDEVAGSITHEFLYPASSCKYVPLQIVRPVVPILRRVVGN